VLWCGVYWSRPSSVSQKPSRKVIRVANEHDMEKFGKNAELEREVYGFCYMKAKERSLPMCLVSVECLLMNTRSWSISRRTAGWISVNSSRTWFRNSAQESR